MSQELPGFGEARMIGIFGKTGCGKSVLAAYIVAGFARNPPLGILILDPQGEFANNFPRTYINGIPFDFHGLLRLTGRRFKVYSIGDIGFKNTDVDAFCELLKKSPYILRNLELRRSQDIDVAVSYLEWYIRGFIRENHTINDITLDQLIRWIMNILPRIFARETAQRKVQQLRSLLSSSFATNQTLRQGLEDRLNQIKALFQSRVSTEEIIDDLIANRDIVIINLEQVSILARRIGITPVELKAMILDRIISALERKGRELFQRGDVANVLVVLDEAHRYVPQRMPKDNEELARLLLRIRDNVKTTRKYGIGWMFITQTTVDFDKEIYRQLHEYFFGYGLRVGADAKHVKEVVPKGAFKIYEKIPDPKKSKKYVFMHVGSSSLVNTVGGVTFIEVLSFDEFIRVNYGITYEEFKQRYSSEAIERLAEPPED